MLPLFECIKLKGMIKVKIVLEKSDIQQAVTDYVKAHYDVNFAVQSVAFSNGQRHVAITEVDVFCNKNDEIKE